MSNPTTPSPSPKRELALEISFWTLVVGGTLVSLIYDYPTLLLICSILFLYIAAVCLHEFGHAIGAFLMGGQVHYIQLGQRFSNKPPWQLSFLGFVWRIYSLPLSGALHSSFFTSDYYRTRRCVMIALGPIFNLLAVLGSAILLVNLELDHTTRTFTLLFGWMLVNGCLVLGAYHHKQFFTAARPTRTMVGCSWTRFFILGSRLKPSSTTPISRATLVKKLNSQLA